MQIKNTIIALLVLVFTSVITDCIAQTKDQILPAVGMPPDPKVPFMWYRYYDSKGLYAIMQKIVKAYPKLAKLKSIGKSYQGRDIWCLTITDFTKGKPDEKPGIYLDGNIHGNEIQGAEFSLYTAWYLTEMSGDNSVIQELLRSKVFYIVPSLHPDGRDHFIHVAGDQGSPRYSMKMNDVQGIPQNLTNDHNYNWANDLDGDGHLTDIRIPSTSDDRYAPYISNPTYPWQLIRMSPQNAPVGVKRYKLIAEGVVKINKEKSDFSRYDLNRNWYWWFGAQDSIKVFSYKIGSILYAFNDIVPQNEQQVVRDFFISHPNISVAESFHNAKGAFFRARAAYHYPYDSTESDRIDEAVYDHLGKRGEGICPGYEYSESSNQLTMHRSIDWMYGARGAYSFITELFARGYAYYQKNFEDNVDEDVTEDSVRIIRANRMASFHENVLFGDGLVPWHKFQHPTFGEVEIGGTKKTFGRIHPGFMIPEDAHRQMAFTLYMASKTAKVEITNASIKALEGTKQEISVSIRNSGLLPTHSAPDLRHGIIPSDLVTIKNAKRIFGVTWHSDNKTIKAEGTDILKINNIPGQTDIIIKWIVEGNDNYTISVKSIRGGVVEQQVKR